MALQPIPATRRGLADFPRKKRSPRKVSLKFLKDRRVLVAAGGALLLSFLFGFGGGVLAFLFADDLASFIGVVVKEGPAQGLKTIVEREVVETEYIPQTTEEEKIISTVEAASPSVVSIIINNPQEVGGGSGFIVSADGLLVTNKHVVLDEKATYTVFLRDGESFTATVLARDPFQDLAILQIEQENRVDEGGNFTRVWFPALKLGNSDSLQIGQTVIAIGNALGEFRNTVSVGVISGLGRTITASNGEGFVETIEDVIQTDAAINRGNSGGPLLNLVGEVIGINTATVIQAQSIGFAVPVNRARKDIEQVEETGSIVYPFLGVQYQAVNKEVREREGLSVDYGALVVGDSQEEAVVPGSAAEEAGILLGDVILEINGEKITEENKLRELIGKHEPGDSVVLKVLREGENKILPVILGERRG
ncbi:trypsin-like peptidase domain-containing protein [Patescibacteria group bacterium]|nr:trypsin-like peptidase domain-containing protein [Patescibacteria group bacterium]